MFKKKPKYSKIQSFAQVKGKLREFLFDSQIPDVNDVGKKLGLTPLSDDLIEREEDESDRRVGRIAYLLPIIYGYSTLFSEAFTSSVIASDKREKKTPLHPDAARHPSNGNVPVTMTMLEDAMGHMIAGTISQMVDLGLLEIPKGHKK